MAFRKWFCPCARISRPVSSKALVLAITMLAGLTIVGSASAWAQVPCPSFPNFRPDFTNNQSCLNLVPMAVFGPPASSVVPPEVTPNLAKPAPQGVNTVLRLTPNQLFNSGAAWFTTPVLVTNGFSNTFTFQLSDSTGTVGDGIAFLVQNSPQGASAIKPDNGVDGCSLGFGQVSVPNAICTSTTGGIPNSLGIEFDTFQNADIGDISNNHVAIQSCGTSPNSVDATCRRKDFDLNTTKIVLADGSVHTATVTYTPPAVGAICDGPCPGTLDVVLDGVDLFPDGGVSFDITSIGLGEGGTAFIGFTGATGGADDLQDILSWSYVPLTSTITLPLTANTLTVFNFGPHVYKVKPNQNIDALSVTAVLTDFNTFQTDRNTIQDFPGAQCIIYDGTGGKCVEYHAVCNSPSNNACGNVSYDVLTSYDVAPNTVINNPGFLKATGKDCTPGITFDSNIITQFFQTRIDPTTKGSSKPSFSCFVAVQNVTYQPADLDILNLAAAKVRPNANLTYVATVGNFGPSGAQGVAISNPIPSGTTYVSSALCSLTNGCSTTPCSFDGTVASCQVGNLDKFGLEFMVTTVKVTAPAGTVLSDTATVFSFNPDPDTVLDRSWTWKTLVSNR